MGVPGISILSANKKDQTSKETFPMSELDIFVQVIGRGEAPPQTNKLAESFTQTRPVQMLCNLCFHFLLHRLRNETSMELFQT